MKASMIALSNCMVVGDRQKYLCILVTLKSLVDLDTGEPTDDLAPDSVFISESIGSNAMTVSEAIIDPIWFNYLKSGLINGNSKAISNAQIIQKFTVLPQDFSEKSGDLTPTLKLKRSVVTTKYQHIIDEMYK